MTTAQMDLDEPVVTAPNVRRIFTGLMLGMFLSSLSQTVVAPAMPRIVAELGGFEHYSWIAVSALIASTITVPIAGKLSDLYGRKPFYVGGIVIFLVGSVLAGLAPTFETLILARVVQGVGMGTMMPLSQAIIGDIVSPRERGKYQGLIGAVFGLASVVGPFVGGYLTDNATWRWLFFLNVPVGLLALGFIVPFMHIPHVRRPHAIDYPGIFALSIALLTGLLATVWGGTQYPWGSVEIIGLYAVSVVAIVGFVVIESRAVEPIIPLHLWRIRTFTLSNIAGLAVAMGMFGAIYFIPVFVQGVIGDSATNSGALLIPMSLSLVVASVINGQFITRTGHYKLPIITGVGALAIGFLLLAQMDTSTTNEIVVRNMIVIGLGLGMVMQTFTLIVQNAVEHRDMGIATAATQLSRSIGGTVGIALLGTVMTQTLQDEIPRRLPPEALGQLGAAGGGQGVGALLDPAQLGQLPAPIVVAIREALALATHNVFVAALPFIAISFVAVLLLREIPLRKHTRFQAAEEAGRELMLELGQSDSDHEPLIDDLDDLEPQSPSKLATSSTAVGNPGQRE
ncbi:MAG: MDR family MFS transporter [Candidatus Limnocylindrales bacterium]